MNFFEQELHKIVAPKYPDATYVGRACYVRLDELNRAKIQFVTGIVANQYHALRVSILNRNEGQVDVLLLNLSDILGKKQTGNPNFRNGKADWYVYHPNSQDYQQLTDAVSDYLEVFQEQAQTADPQWQQTM